MFGGLKLGSVADAMIEAYSCILKMYVMWVIREADHVKKRDLSRKYHVSK